jgi:hypothetical protein
MTWKETEAKHGVTEAGHHVLDQDRKTAGVSCEVSERTQNQFSIVCYYRKLGLNVFPLRADGTRVPKGKWKAYHQEKVPAFLLRRHFEDPRAANGIAGICGSTSGNLEVLDFDDVTVWKPWIRAVSKRLSGLFGYAPLVETPKGGRHLTYRCDQIEGNQVLARDDSAEKKVRIETRGQGGFVVLPGSHPETHPTGRPYRLIGGNYAKIPTITPDQRRIVLEIARSFDQSPPKRKSQDVPRVAVDVATSPGVPLLEAGVTPWDDFNARGPSWEEMLTMAGWIEVGMAGDATMWRRPGKDSGGASASTGHCGDLFHVFSSNARPFEAGGTYSKFAVLTWLHFGGDFRHSTRALATLGFGHHRDEQIEEQLKEIIG